MKKLILLAVLAVFSLSSVNAQELRAGLTFGIPIGDAGDIYTFNFGLDVSYLFLEVSEEFNVGLATGYNTSSGDDLSQTVTVNGITATTSVEYEDFNYIPLAAAGRYSVSETFLLGADLGYAVASGDVDGGFYYRPMVGYDVSEAIQVTASYRGVSVKGGSFSTFNIGATYKLM